MTANQDYTINKDMKYGFLNLIDIDRISGDVTSEWFNQSLCRVNDCVVRLGVVKGEFHWHHHDDEDEFFYIISGKLFIDLEDRTIELEPNPDILASVVDRDPVRDGRGEHRPLRPRPAGSRRRRFLLTRDDRPVRRIDLGAVEGGVLRRRRQDEVLAPAL
jgi:hypothetical protein